MTSPIPFNTVLMHIPGRTPSTHAEPHDLHKAVDKAFITALLLTGSTERAEDAILEGNRVMDGDSTPGEALLEEP